MLALQGVPLPKIAVETSSPPFVDGLYRVPRVPDETLLLEALQRLREQANKDAERFARRTDPDTGIVISTEAPKPKGILLPLEGRLANGTGAVRRDPNEGSGEGGELTASDLRRALELRLSFCDLRRLCNLDVLQAIQHLFLDNNQLTQIENLQALSGLRCLDLSFNSIERIEGLDKLEALEDLILTRNEVKRVENLERCRRLRYLSLQSNPIESFDDLNFLLLRMLPDLKAVNLQNCPVSRNVEYVNRVVALLPQMEYLDFQCISSEQRLAAVDHFQSQIDELRRIEEHQQNLERRATMVAEEQTALRDVNLFVIETLFDDMMEADTEMARLQNLPGFTHMKLAYQAKIDELVVSFRHKTLKYYEKRIGEEQVVLREIEKFSESSAKTGIEEAERIENARKKMDEDIIQILAPIKAFAKIPLLLQQNPSVDNTKAPSAVAPAQSLEQTIREKLEEHREGLVGLADELMHYEMQKAMRIDACLKSYEGSVKRYDDGYKMALTAFFKAVSDLERVFHEGLETISRKCHQMISSADKVDHDVVQDEGRKVITEQVASVSTFDTPVERSRSSRLLQLPRTSFNNDPVGDAAQDIQSPTDASADGESIRRSLSNTRRGSFEAAGPFISVLGRSESAISRRRSEEFSKEVSALADQYVSSAHWSVSTMKTIQEWDTLVEALHGSNAIHQAHILSAEDATMEQVGAKIREADQVIRQIERERQVKRISEIVGLRKDLEADVELKLATILGMLDTPP
uniref:Dynein regulatory complex subunit 3 n=1 Tax=Pinguiococcus pyrenoidosus TaxID=172671 RepID=A0A7R9UEA9_9STRA|mmetsp:Transcript_5642/g.22183  ORF Transcript_5642/g.22183 Transcript_5642/m.22183 type:complete len:750 (+) Transcript_5642:183-2432(+)